jgi:hypothetical protein
MTIPPPDTGLICRIRLTAEGRWLTLALSLSDLAPTNRFVVFPEGLSHEIRGLDELTQTYGLSNWQGGIISGARYAFRKLKSPPRQVRVHELRGQLGSSDVSALSSATAIAVAHLLARPQEISVDLEGWTIQAELSPPPASGMPTGAEASSSTAAPIEQPAQHPPLL